MVLLSMMLEMFRLPSTSLNRTSGSSFSWRLRFWITSMFWWWIGLAKSLVFSGTESDRRLRFVTGHQSLSSEVVSNSDSDNSLSLSNCSDVLSVSWSILSERNIKNRKDSKKQFTLLDTLGIYRFLRYPLPLELSRHRLRDTNYHKNRIVSWDFHHLVFDIYNRRREIRQYLLLFSDDAGTDLAK